MSIDLKKVEIMSCNDELAIEAAHNAMKQYLESRHLVSEFEGANSSIKIEKGLVLYKQQNSPFFWVRYTDKEQNVINQRASTKENTINKAKAAALIFKAQKIEQAKSGKITNSRFKKWQIVCSEKLKEYEAETRRQKSQGKPRPTSMDYAGIIRNKFIDIELLRNCDITSIGYSELYDLSREEIFDSLGKTTSIKIKTTLKSIFEYALRKKYIFQMPEIPSFDFMNGEGAKPFTTKDRDVIFSPSNLIGFLENASSYDSKYIRSQFPHYISFVELSGLRPGEEVVNIHWSDIKKGEVKQKSQSKKLKGYYVVVRRGKMQKNKRTRKSEMVTESRQMLLYSEAAKELEKIYFLRFGIKRSIEEIVTEGKTSPIFITEKGNKPNFSNTFTQYIQYINKNLEREYSSYSLRHEFINRKLDEGMKVEDIASQCGNSVETIEKYYEEYRAMNRAARLYNDEDLAYFNQTIDTLAA